MASDYNRGEMDITDQKDTFDGFMAVTVWSSLLTIVSVLYLTLVFAVGMGWMAGLLVCTVVGIVGGLALNMRAAWYFTVGALFVMTLVFGGVVTLFNAAFLG
ncbi:aa3-type cytochrome c oxidase subunit IV [Maricaulis sp. D1M11]|uniref:aa3-type cytochrome c oxidase subunit IV n=1 Tax=Maricaulis sp. D1M11 TaxID=3076117 RepID=UPI0039B62D6B